MIEAVIFDIGGVLAHDVWEHLLLDEERGVASIFNLDRVQVQTVGYELWEAFAYRPVTAESEWQTLERAYWDLFRQRLGLAESADYFIQLTDDFIKPVAGMVPLLEGLQAQGVKLAICSNNNAFWSERQMQKLSLHRFFEPQTVIFSHQIGVSKSSAGFELFRAAVAALGCAEDACIFVDDRAESIGRALQFGLAGILFPSHSDYGGHYLEALLAKMGVV